MDQEYINLKDQQVLHEIKEYLSKISVAGTVLESSADMPFNVLVAITAQQVSVNVMYVPLPEDQFEEVRLMQLYTLILPAVRSESKTDFLTLLNDINNQCPIGSFFINEKEELCYKYIFPLDRFAIPKEVYMQEVFSLFTGSLNNYHPKLISLSDKSQTLEQVLSSLS